MCVNKSNEHFTLKKKIHLGTPERFKVYCQVSQGVPSGEIRRAENNENDERPDKTVEKVRTV